MNSKYTFILLFAFFLLASCGEELAELNQNPNEPTAVPPSVIFPYALREGVDRMHGHRTRLERLGLDGGMLWVQYFARNQYTNEGDTYNPDASMRNNNWKGFFNESIINFQKVIEATGDPENTFYNENYYAAALVMREYMFSVITDTWGSIPYSQALKGSTEGNLAPVYDSQEQVYAGILANLKVAAESFDVGGSEIIGDNLFAGDVLRWQKFTNSLRLRLANRQAKASPAASAAVFTEILSNPETYPLFTSNEDHALLIHEGRLNDNNNNAWHEIMVVDGREDWSISETLISKMTDGEGNMADPRLSVFAEQVTAGDAVGKYSGAPNGLPEALASIYINTASRPGSWFSQERAPVFLMTFAELQFILAEATLDGDYSGGLTAKEYMELGIQASFDQFDLEMPSLYYSELAADKETIMTEKWKALFSQGIESWTEVRRTGFPILSEPNINAIFENNGMMPTRLRYPESEYSLNGNNVETGVQLNGGPDNKQTPLWWVD